ncbi:MAG: 5'-3' exonuclease [Candidatus Nanopelagicales bacterium]
MLLLDSASLYYRSFFALPESITSPSGQPVNAVRGFLDTVAALARDRGPSAIVACWDDDWRPRWRVDLIPTYKTHRVLDETDDTEVTPDALAPQVDMLREILPALGIPVVGREGAEADDVIADLSATHRGPVDIASGDRDLVQLVSDRVTLLFTGGTSASRGGKPWLVLTPELAEQRYGVPPAHYADLAVLRGDPSDGLPGVKGIGEKTAAALVREFGGLEAILSAAADTASPRPMTPALRSRLLESAEEIRRAERVVRLSPDPSAVAKPAASADAAEVDRLAAEWGVSAAATRLRESLR